MNSENTPPKKKIMIFGNIFDLEVRPSEGLDCLHAALSIRNLSSILLIYTTNQKIELVKVHIFNNILFFASVK